MSTSDKADPEWDHHKATIKLLWKKNDLKGLMETMERSHGFVRSKAQYERHLKNWGMRKYRTKDEWEIIGSKVAKRKRAGKESVVSINNELIPKAKVQKQIRRNTFTTVFDQNVPTPTPQTPEGFAIRTPTAQDMTPPSHLQDVIPSSPLWTGMDDHPFSQFQNASPSITPRMGTNDFPLLQLQNATFSSPPTMGTDEFSFSVLQNTTTEQDEFSFSPIGDVANLFQHRINTNNLPFFQLEAGLHAQVNLPPIPTNALRPGIELSSRTPLSLEDRQDTSYEVVGMPHAVLKGPESLTATLKALLPNTAGVSQVEEQLISSPDSYRSDSTVPRLLRLLLFAITNNFAGVDRLQPVEVVEYLKRQANTRLLQSILNTSGPGSEAFAENLFSAAIESGDARTVEVLLQKGLNPNDLMCTVNGRNFTPIERSSNLRNIEITRLLLRAKADVNKTFKGWSGDHGAIRCAIGRRSRTVQSHLPLELVRMLLDAGGKVTVRLIEDCAAYLYEDSTNLLIDFHAKTKPLALLHSRIPENVAERWDNERATRTVIKICKIYADSIEGVAPTFNEYLGPTLDTAAQRGNLDLVQFLLRSCVPLSHVTLVNAIRGKNKDIIRLLVDAGVEFLGSDDYLALAEAIRWGDVEILDLLEHKGAWSWIGAAKENRAAFRTVLQAASDVGQLTIVQKVLDHRPTYTTGLDLNGALESAILANQEALALMLLDAGADVNEGIPEDGALNTSSRTLFWALCGKNANIVWSILEADVNISSEDLREAVEWGNHSIIEELISMSVDVNASNEDDECSALVISVEEKDTKSMQLLLNAGADVNSVGQGGRGGLRKTALTAAVTNGDVEMVEHLLSIGADPYDTWALSQALSHGMSMIEKLLTAFNRRYPSGRIGYGGDALIVAIWEGDHELFEILLQAGIDANTVARELTLDGPAVGKECQYLDFLTPLGAAIVDEHAGSLAILQRLLSANGNANSIVRSPMCTAKETALLAAVDTKDIQKVQLLIDAGADVNRPAMRGIKRTPLQKAAEIGSFGATQILIDNGALVNAQPAKRGGATALQLAAIGGYTGIAELLLDNGADINAPAAKVDGRTALEGAAEHGRIDMLRLLSNAGAKLHGSEYERALQLAKENGHMATRRYLESLSAEAGGSTLDI